MCARIPEIGLGSYVRLPPKFQRKLDLSSWGGCRVQHTRCRGSEPLGLDVVVGIPGIDETRATRSEQSIRKGPVVAIKEALRIATRSPGGRKGNTIAHFKDAAQLPSVRDPCGWP